MLGLPGLLVLLGFAAFVPHSFGQAAEGFVPLFDGSTLEGWKGEEGLWSVEDGAIVGTSDGHKLKQNTFLIHEKSFSDFTLRIKVKLRNHNSGVQFRSEARPDFVVAGYQADVADEYFGMLYEEQKRGFMPYWKAFSEEEKNEVRSASIKGEWNEFVITCKGDSVKMVLNGKTVCDMIDPEGAKKGIIALQLHAGPDMRVEFKDIAIQEIK